ncbi:hypothetical protein [Ornithinimicrobium kibberense]
MPLLEQGVLDGTQQVLPPQPVLVALLGGPHPVRRDEQGQPRPVAVTHQLLELGPGHQIHEVLLEVGCWAFRPRAASLRRGPLPPQGQGRIGPSLAQGRPGDQTPGMDAKAPPTRRRAWTFLGLGLVAALVAALLLTLDVGRGAVWSLVGLALGALLVGATLFASSRDREHS